MWAFAQEDADLMMDMDMELLEQKKGMDESQENLSELIRILNEMPFGEKGEIESILDVNSVLQYMAGNSVIHNWDDYAGQFAHNYYFYMNDGLFRMLPWDMNEGFLQTQAFYRESDGARQDIASPITGNATPKERPLVEKILAVPEYYEKYLEYCETLRQWLQTLPVLKERIASGVKQYSTSFFTYGEFEQEFDSGYHNGLAGFVKECEAYLTERLTELLGSQ